MSLPLAAISNEEDTFGAFFTRAARELEALRMMALRLERALCASLANNGLDEARMHEVQDCDFLVQHLAALRDVLAVLSVTPQADTPIDATDALSRLTLSALRERLGGKPYTPGEGQSGELELL